MDVSAISQSTSSVTDVTNTDTTQKTHKHHHSGKRPEPPSVDQMLSQLTSKLGLNDNQVIALKKILQQNSSKMDELMKTADSAQGADKSSTRQQMKTLMDSMTDSIKGILTDDQLKTFNTMLANNKPPDDMSSNN